MPWITVYGLPKKLMGERTLEDLKRSITNAALSVKELGLKSDGSEITIFFPSDIEDRILDGQVVIEIKLLESQRRTEDVQARLVKTIGTAAKEVLIDLHVDCFPVIVKRKTFWSSRP